MKTGDIYILTQGDYSYYGIVETVRAIQDFDLNEKWSVFLEADKGTTDFDPWGRIRRFVAQLRDDGFVELAPVREMWLGQMTMNGPENIWHLREAEGT